PTPPARVKPWTRALSCDAPNAGERDRAQIGLRPRRVTVPVAGASCRDRPVLRPFASKVPACLRKTRDEKRPRASEALPHRRTVRIERRKTLESGQLFRRTWRRTPSQRDGIAGLTYPC